MLLNGPEDRNWCMLLNGPKDRNWCMLLSGPKDRNWCMLSYWLKDRNWCMLSYGLKDRNWCMLSYGLKDRNWAKDKNWCMLPNGPKDSYILNQSTLQFPWGRPFYFGLQITSYSLVSHRSESADFTCETNKNGTEYSFLSQYFIYFASKQIFCDKLKQILKKNINWGLRLVKPLFDSMQIFASKYSLLCEYLLANIPFKTNILKQIFGSTRKWIFACEFVRIF